jgi:hypothetical protein
MNFNRLNSGTVRIGLLGRNFYAGFRNPHRGRCLPSSIFKFDIKTTVGISGEGMISLGDQ